MKRFLAVPVFVVLFTLSLIMGCGGTGTVENETLGPEDPPEEQAAEDKPADAPPDSAGSPSESPPPDSPATPPYTSTLSSDASIPSGNTAVIFNSNWNDPIGSLSSISLSNISSANTALITSDGADAIVRSFGGKIYVVNRFGTDTIQVIDPSNFSVIGNYSVGAGSNPQDIAVVSDDKAYISRLDSQNDDENTDDVLIVNPLTGERFGSFNLKPYTTEDGDRFARAAQMTIVGSKVYVCMQDLPENMLLSANTNGKVAVIDTTMDDLFDADPNTPGIQVIELAGRNPSDITYSPLTKKIYIADTGVYVNWAVDTSDSNGGIEVIDPQTNTSEGIVIDDALFGGGVAEVRLASDTLGFTIIDSVSIASFNPSTNQVFSTNVYTTPGFFLPDFSIDQNGRLLIAEQDFNNPGIVAVNASDGSAIAGPVGVGAPPVSITFVDR